MALDARRKQKKVERRAAKQRERKLIPKQQAEQAATRTLQAVSTAPIVRCCMTVHQFSDGMQEVLVSRALPNHRVAFSLFLLDTYCLGVKDATFDILPLGDFELNIFGRLKARFRLVKIEPAFARKLVEGAVSYALDLGFPPHADYADAKLIFGDIDPNACPRVFEYGKAGKPMFIAGPYDNRPRCERIVRTLNERCGADGFDFLIPQAQIESMSGSVDDDR